MTEWRRVPFETVEGLLAGLPALELRRHMSMVQLTDFVAKWAMQKNAPEWRAWLPAFARTSSSHPVPSWVMDDVRVGVRLRVLPQDLYDAVKALGG